MGLSPLTESTQNLSKYALIEKIGDLDTGACVTAEKSLKKSWIT